MVFKKIFWDVLGIWEKLISFHNLLTQPFVHMFSNFKSMCWTTQNSVSFLNPFSFPMNRISISGKKKLTLVFLPLLFKFEIIEKRNWSG